ncbi:MAG: PQQ-dependent sugar dehydrogenase [Candidatus Binatia bacterium]
MRLSSSATPGPFARPTAPWATDAGTVGLWHFDEGNGDLISDGSGVNGPSSDGERRVGGPSNGPQWSTDVPFASPAPAVTLEAVTSGLDQPTSITNAGDNRLFITEQTGAIRIWDGTQLLATPFLTVAPIACCGEQGLLSVAFHPDYASNGFFYVYYINPAGQVVIARYKRSNGNPNLADPMSVILLTIDHPASNHNGGQLQFGPDGYLYAGIGDSSGSCDDAGAACNSQNDGRLLGKILRLDVNQNVNAAPCYGIPPDNPTSVPATRSTRSGPRACAIRGASASTRSPTASSSATSARARARRSTWCRPARPAGSTSAGDGGLPLRHLPAHRLRRHSGLQQPGADPADPRLQARRRQLLDHRRRVPRHARALPLRQVPVRRPLLRPPVVGDAEQRRLGQHGLHDHRRQLVYVRPGCRWRALRRPGQRHAVEDSVS